MNFGQKVDDRNLNKHANRFKESFKRFRCMKSEQLQTVSLTEKVPIYISNVEVLDQFSSSPRHGPNYPSANLQKTTVESAVNGHQCPPMFGLQPPQLWEVWRFEFPEGLIFIRNPFLPEGQRYWITRCVMEFPNNSNHITNISNLRKQFDTPSLANNCQHNSANCDEKRLEELKKLRWVTFGYHHNWDTKVYSEDSRCTFPPDLGQLAKYIAAVLGYDDFEAEAAIVNYYHLNSTLSGHQDKSERNGEAPLISLSFGQGAIFLIGGETKDISPIPVIIRSGDIVVMTGRSRLSYHGVPRILATSDLPWQTTENPTKLSDASNSHDNEPSSKKCGYENTRSSEKCKFCKFAEATVFEKDDNTWTKFLSKYANKSRINLNIRQVLFPGETRLP